MIAEIANESDVTDSKFILMTIDELYDELIDYKSIPIKNDLHQITRKILSRIIEND